MKRVAVIQDLGVVDRILAHLRRIGGNDPWEGHRATRAAGGRASCVTDVNAFRWPLHACRSRRR